MGAGGAPERRLPPPTSANRKTVTIGGARHRPRGGTPDGGGGEAASAAAAGEAASHAAWMAREEELYHFWMMQVANQRLKEVSELAKLRSTLDGVQARAARRAPHPPPPARCLRPCASARVDSKIGKHPSRASPLRITPRAA